MAMEIFRLMGTVAISKDQALKDIKAIQTQAEKTSTAMGKSFTKFSGFVEQHSAQIKKAGKYLTVFGGIATAAFALSVKSAANFETQLANVSTMLDKSAMKILPEYRKGLQSLSVDFGESTETLSKGLYDILSASIPPAEALGVLEVSAKAAAAGITDTGVAADAITTILNSYGMSADQAGMVSDKLFAIVKGGKTTFAELAPSIGKVAATASMAGLSFDDLGACIATMTRAGIRTEETMTAINGVLIAFLKPTDEAKEAAKKFGLELNTNTLRTLGLTGVMEKLNDATAEQLAAIFPNIRGLKGMAAALGDAEGYARDYALMLNSAGLTQEAFEKQSATLNFKLGQLKEMFNVIKVTVGTALIPAVEDLVRRGMEILKGVKEWTEANKPLTETIVKWAAGISVLMLVLGPLVMLLPGIVTALPIIASGLIAVSGAFASFATILALTAPELFAISVAIALVTKATYGWIDAIKESKRIRELEIESAKSTAAALKKLQEAYHMTNEEIQEYTKTHMLSHAVLERAAQDARDLAKIQYQLISTGRSLVELTKETATPFVDLASAIDVVNTIAGESGITVDSLNKEMETLTETFQLSQRYITENNKSVLDTITYYNSMISLMNNLASGLSIELSLLEAGTEEYNKKEEEINKNKKALTEMRAALEALMAPLTGLDLINAKLAILGNTAEDNNEKLKILGDKSIELKQKLDASIPDTEEWWKWNNALAANEQSIKDLSNTIAESELTRLGAKLAYLNTKFQEGRPTVVGYKGQISTLNSELSILKTKLKEAEPESAAYYNTKLAVGDLEAKIKDLTTSMNDLILGKDTAEDGLKDLGDTIEEVGEKTAKSSSITTAQLNEAFGGVVKTIDLATGALNNFTEAGVAAAIAAIKMKFLPALNDVREIMSGLSEAFFEGALSAVDYNTLQIFYQKQINDLLAEQKERVDTVLYGWKEYQKILAGMEGGAGGGIGYDLGGIIKGLQRGGGVDSVLIRATPGEYVVDKPMTDFIKRTGIVPSQLTKAIVSGQPTPAPGMQRGGIVGLGASQEIKYDIGPIYVAGDGDVGKIRSAIKQALDESNLQILRSGSEVIPGVD